MKKDRLQDNLTNGPPVSVRFSVIVAENFQQRRRKSQVNFVQDFLVFSFATRLSSEVQCVTASDASSRLRIQAESDVELFSVFVHQRSQCVQFSEESGT